MTQAKANAGLLSQAPPEASDSAAAMQLGGITVYARNQEQLERGLETWSTAILRGARAHPSLDRKMLLSVTANELGSRLDQRVFDGVLGSVMRKGRIDRIPCASETSKVFRILIAAERLTEFEERCRELGDWLEGNRQLAIRNIRDRYFGSAWGAWTSASHLVCRLVLIGRAEHVDRYTCAWPAGLEDAVR